MRPVDDDNLVGAVGPNITVADPNHNYTGHAVNQIVANATAKLQRFKDWVHKYLDDHGVPHHPPGTHGAEGCRIGDRMDWLMERVDLSDKAT